MKLLKVDTLEDAIRKLNSVAKNGKKEKAIDRVKLVDSFGRTLANDIYSNDDVPGFDRSVVDGYAVKSNETSGATETMPTFLKLVGEIEMGKEPERAINAGECMYIPTGGMMPEGADAVVMVEYTEKFTDDQVAIYQAVSFGRGVCEKGDDCKKGDLLLKKGARIGASEMGLLASSGNSYVEVSSRKKICIISTGDELVSPEEKMQLGQVRDINTYALIGAAHELDIEIVKTISLADDKELLKREVIKAMEMADIVAISGGSSQGKKDVTESVIDEVCSSGVITHGISIKPGKPTITGYDEETDTIVIGLPGHPAAALIIFKEFFGNRGKSIMAKMASNIASAPGRKTIQLVTLETRENEQYAVPILSKSGMINAVVKADGYILTDINCEGVGRDEKVEVFLL